MADHREVVQPRGDHLDPGEHSDPPAWPALGSGDQAATVSETHTAVLMLTGGLVLKVKKPVRFPFLDFSTRQLREQACHREVDLNRRLAPDVYLGVTDMVDPDGEPWEHAVVMRRMPSDRCMANLVVDGNATVEQIRSTARALAAFHASAARDPDIDAMCTRDSVRRLWDENLAELHDLAGDVIGEERIEQIERRTVEYLDGREALFDERISKRACCDGHGDLQAADIFCLDDGPRILDCIEFDDRYRFGDVISDIAFLAMDLERLGSPELGEAFVDAYEAVTGEALPGSLLHHYVAYRALVRAKVAALRSRQEVDGELSASDRVAAAALVDLCLRHLERSEIRVVMIGGLPGTGKTTLATGLAERFGATLLRSDVIRKELAGIEPEQPAPADIDEGIYGAGHTRATYAELVRRAADAASHGESVVLDASWTRASDRQLAREAAAATHSSLVEICCELDSETAAARLRARTATGSDASDATAAIAAALARREDPWPEAEHIRTDERPAVVLDEAAGALERGVTSPGLRSFRATRARRS